MWRIGNARRTSKTSGWKVGPQALADSERNGPHDVYIGEYSTNLLVLDAVQSINPTALRHCDELQSGLRRLCRVRP